MHVNKSEPIETKKGLHDCCATPLKRPGCGCEQTISRILSRRILANPQGAIIYPGRGLVVNQNWLRVGVPPECFAYRLGNRSALEWVIDQYQMSEHKRSRIVSDPNNPEDEEYNVRLVEKVVTVSMEMVRLVNELAQAVIQEDCMSQPPVQTR